MSEVAWLLSAGFAVLLVLGVPFAIALGLVTVACLATSGIEPLLLAQTAISGTESFSLLAIPFFMLAGELMSAGGLSQRLIGVAEVFVRHLPGGMGLVTILAACIFAAISGSAAATTAAIGTLLIPAMVERGYSKPFAVSLAVSAGVLGPLIPPSIAGVIWGVVSQQSIARIFLSTVIPGLLLAGGLMVIACVYAVRNGIKREPRASLREIGQALRGGAWALGAPIVVLGGIYGGAFTPTEAAVVACVYSMVVGVVIERRMAWSDLPAAIGKAMRITGVVMSIIALSAGFGWLIAQEQLPTRLAHWVAGNVHSSWSMLLMLNLFVFLICTVMDEIAVVVILGPTLMALTSQFGVDPIHFGALIVTNIAIGMAAPPIGYCLFIGMAISKVPLGALSRAIWPQVTLMLAVLLLTTYVPALALWLPGLAYR